MNLTRKCPVCCNTIGIRLDEINFVCETNNCLPNHYDIVCCENCGFAFANMDANQSDFDEYYSNMNIYSEAENLRNSSSKADEGYYGYIFNIINKYISMNAKILDVGCGGGQLLDFLKNKGYKNLTGMDPSKESIDYIKSKGHSGLVNSIFDDIDEENMFKYDIVISTMVAEHIYDLDKYLEQLKSFVNNNGYVFVTVPAVEGFERYICSKPNYFNQEHINLFSFESIKNIFGKHKLYAINEDYTNNCEEEQKLYVLFKKGVVERPIKKDDVSLTSIKNYLEKNKMLNKELNEKIDYLIQSDKKIVIWGCGQYSKQIISQFPLIISKIKYFVDNNTIKHGGCLANKEIYSPNKLQTETEDLIVCICSMKNGMDIMKQLINDNIKYEHIIL